MSREVLFDIIHYNIPEKSSITPDNILEDIINKSNRFEKIIDKQILNMKKQGMDVNSCLEYLNSIVEEYVHQIENGINLRLANRKDSIKKYWIKEV